MVVAALGLDRLDNDSSDGVVEGFDEFFGFSEATRFFFCIFFGVFGERVFQVREAGLGPVEGRDVEFVDGFAAGGGERTKEAAVESGLEG